MCVCVCVCVYKMRVAEFLTSKEIDTTARFVILDQTVFHMVIIPLGKVGSNDSPFSDEYIVENICSSNSVW